MTPDVSKEGDIAQMVECPPVKLSIILLILHSGPICSLGYLPFKPVVHNYSVVSASLSVGKWDHLLLIGKSSRCGDSGFPL